MSVILLLLHCPANSRGRRIKTWLHTRTRSVVLALCLLERRYGRLRTTAGQRKYGFSIADVGACLLSMPTQEFGGGDYRDLSKVK